MKQILLPVFIFLSAVTATAQSPKAVLAYDKAIALANENKHADALAYFKQATDLYPQYYEAFLMAGTSFARLSLHNDAKFCFTKAIKLRPKDCIPYMTFGNYFKEVRGKADSALIYYEKALAMNCDTNNVLNFNLGWCYNDKEQFQKAMVYLKKAIEKDNTYRNAINEISYSFRKLEKLQDGIDYFQPLYDATKMDVYLYYIGLYNILLNQKDKAVANAEELRRIQSKLADNLEKKIKAMKP